MRSLTDHPDIPGTEPENENLLSNVHLQLEAGNTLQYGLQTHQDAEGALQPSEPHNIEKRRGHISIWANGETAWKKPQPQTLGLCFKMLMTYRYTVRFTQKYSIIIS